MIAMLAIDTPSAYMDYTIRYFVVRLCSKMRTPFLRMRQNQFSVIFTRTILGLMIVLLSIGAPLAYAQTGALVSKHPQADYQAGFTHGVQDAQPTTKHVYIWSPGHAIISICQLRHFY